MDKGRFGRQDRLIKEKQNDVYFDRHKYSEPTLCTTCNSLYLHGRWTWETTDQSVNKAVCPACKRIIDNYPAGTIEITGSFFKEHEDDLTNLIFNIEKQEKMAHALERIIEITHKRGITIITTTGIHLARRIGEALSRSYKGNLSFRYLDADKGIRVSWER